MFVCVVTIFLAAHTTWFSTLESKRWMGTKGLLGKCARPVNEIF